MPAITVEESGMTFGKYDSEDFLHIEKCHAYSRGLSNSGVKISEFILYRNNKLIILEAKTSCPNIENKTNHEKFVQYVDEIVEKFENTLNVYANIFSQRYNNLNDIPNKFMSKAILKNSELCFVLVIKKAKKEWLVNYPDIFKKKLNTIMKIWKIRQLLVINEETAIRMKLVQEFE